MKLALGLLLAATTFVLTPAWAQPTAFCPYGQTCQNAPPVPFPVINPVQGLRNALTLPLGQDQQAPPPPAVGLRSHRHPAPGAAARSQTLKPAPSRRGSPAL